MEEQLAVQIKFYYICIALLFAMGLYCIIVTRNLLRTVIGLELLIKAVTLLIIVIGYTSNRIALAQTIVILLIIIEVVVVAIAVGIILNIYMQNDSLDTRNLRNLKG